MEPIKIRPIDKKIVIRFTGQRITLPADVRARVAEYWKGLMREKPALRNGEVFTVQAVQEDNELIRIELAETSYAHYLYSRQVGDLGEYTVRIIHPAALVLAGNQMIFGSMGSHTSLAGMIQCCGGGIDSRAVGADGAVAIEHTMITELSEELGLEIGDGRIESMEPKYLKFGGPTGKMTLVYIVRLGVSSQSFLQDYESFVNTLTARREDAEFEKLFVLDMDKTKVEAFINKQEDKLNEYMPILLRKACDELRREL